MQNVKRKYEVFKVPEENRTPRRITKLALQSKRKGKKGKRASFEYTEEPDTREQYDVYFPNGHSLRVIGGPEAMEELGLSTSENAGLVDMNTGEEVDEMKELDLRSVVARKTRPARNVSAA